VTILEYRHWTDDQEYICTVCRDAAEPEPTEASFNIDVFQIYDCIPKTITATI